jgi:hypothetical protein
MTSSTDRASAMARQATSYLVGRLVRNRGGALTSHDEGNRARGLFAGVSSCPAPVAAQHEPQPRHGRPAPWTIGRQAVVLASDRGAQCRPRISERGAPFSTAGFAKLIERAGTEAGFKFKVHAHMLRHACGYALANASHDTRSLQAYLGYRNIQHTVRYTELSPDAPARPAGAITVGPALRRPPRPARFKNFWR